MKKLSLPSRLLGLLFIVHTAMAGIPSSPAPVAGESPELPLSLKPPDGKIELQFFLNKVAKPKQDEEGGLYYRVSYQGRPVILDSRLGLQMRNYQLLHDFKILGSRVTTSDSTWKPVNGERTMIRDHYNQLVVDLQVKGEIWGARRMSIVFRAYDEGVAFYYHLPKDHNGEIVDITNELTQFVFAKDQRCWPVNVAQADYSSCEKNIGKISDGAERPLTVQVEDHLYASIFEARSANYPRMKFSGRNETVSVMLDAESSKEFGCVATGALGKMPFSTPWRAILLAESPGKLLEHNDLILNLNDPCQIADTSWIQPGGVIRDVTLTTEGSKACIDFAAKHHLKYILWDAGWYGPEADPDSDARMVAPQKQQVLNLQEVIDYGNSKGIGLILYINRWAIEQQLDEVLPLYEKWGVKGVKYGFVRVGSQFAQGLIHEAIRKAAAHHLMVDIHDEFRSMGYERTYPNLMTVEGIHGDEGKPNSTHHTILPFTRFLSGPADNTFCWNAKGRPNNKAHQLAISTIFYSPWATLYWYDEPKNIQEEPALEYWDHLPTTWDETRVLQGEPRRRVVVARRKGNEWFLGAIAPVDGKFPIALDFLPASKKFTAHIYSDGPDGKSVKVETQKVDAGSVIQADILTNGGMAIRLSPE